SLVRKRRTPDRHSQPLCKPPVAAQELLGFWMKESLHFVGIHWFEGIVLASDIEHLLADLDAIHIGDRLRQMTAYLALDAIEHQQLVAATELHGFMVDR